VAACIQSLAPVEQLSSGMGLCISWVIEIHFFVKVRQLVITMVKYYFCCGSIKYWSKRCHPHKSKQLAMQTFPLTFS